MSTIQDVAELRQKTARGQSRMRLPEALLGCVSGEARTFEGTNGAIWLERLGASRHRHRAWQDRTRRDESLYRLARCPIRKSTEQLHSVGNKGATNERNGWCGKMA